MITAAMTSMSNVFSFPVVNQPHASCDICLPQVSFIFRVEPSHNILCWCLLWWLISNLRFWCGCSLHQWGSTISVCMTNPLEHTHGRHMCLLVLVLGPWRSAPCSCSLHLVGRMFCCLITNLLQIYG